jgi:hypothetical protein
VSGDLALLLVHVACTLFMMGLIWTIQVVHYPLFARVGEREFPAFERAHQRRIAALLPVPWAGEVLTALAVVVVAPAGTDARLAWAGLVVALATVVLTVAVFAPMHGRLDAGRDEVTLRRLVGANWLRTALWSAHGIIAVMLLAQFADR